MKFYAQGSKSNGQADLHKEIFVRIREEVRRRIRSWLFYAAWRKKRSGLFG